MDELMEHETGESQEVQSGQHTGQPLVVTGQTPEAGRPRETAFHDPALGQEDKAVFGLRQLDDVQANAVLGSGFCRRLAGVAFIDVGHLHVRAGDRLHLSGQRRDLGALVVTGRGDSLSPICRPRISR